MLDLKVLAAVFLITLSVQFTISQSAVNSTLCDGYVLSAPIIYAYYPKGLKVFMRGDHAFSSFSFHGNLNRKMNGLEAGQYSGDTQRPKAGVYVYRDNDAELKIGDTIYYWTYVIRNGMGYRYENGVFNVTELMDQNGNPVKCNCRCGTTPDNQDLLMPESV